MRASQWSPPVLQGESCYWAGHVTLVIGESCLSTKAEYPRWVTRWNSTAHQPDLSWPNATTAPLLYTKARMTLNISTSTTASFVITLLQFLAFVQMLLWQLLIWNAVKADQAELLVTLWDSTVYPQIPQMITDLSTDMLDTHSGYHKANQLHAKL